MSESPKEVRLSASQAKVLDKQSKSILFVGASLSQLAVLFDKDARTVAKKLVGLEPDGVRTGFPIWAIKNAAPYLVKPMGDIEEHIRKMHHRDLPPLLLKEYWSGQRAKQQVEEEAGDLWRTDAVIEHVAGAFKVCRTSLLLLSDAVERETSFSDRQRELLKGLIDGALEDLRANLIGEFEHDEEGGEGHEFEGGGALDSEADDEAFFYVPEEDEPL